MLATCIESQCSLQIRDDDQINSILLLLKIVRIGHSVFREHYKVDVTPVFATASFT